MKTYLGEGETVVVTAPETVDSGEFIKVGELYGVAPVAAANGDPVVLERCGVFTLPKASGAWAQGDKLYWDSASKNFTTDASKTPVRAVAFAAAQSGDATGQVLVGAGPDVKIVAGTGTLDGSNPTPIATGLTTCKGGIAVLNKTTAPGVGTSSLTTGVSSGTLNVYAWKVTASGDATLVASTGTEDFFWIAWGY